MLFVSLNKYLRYIFRRYCRKDWYIVLMCVRLGLGINFNPLDSASTVVEESSVSDRLTMLFSDVRVVADVVVKFLFAFVSVVVVVVSFCFRMSKEFRLDVEVVIWVSCNVGFVACNSVCVEVSENFEFVVRCPVV